MKALNDDNSARGLLASSVSMETMWTKLCPSGSLKDA
jgi:hypothetical protein